MCSTQLHPRGQNGAPGEHFRMRVTPQGRCVLGATLCRIEEREGDGCLRGRPPHPRAPPWPPSQWAITPHLEGFPHTYSCLGQPPHVLVLIAPTPILIRQAMHVWEDRQCESSMIKTSRGGRFMQTFISISISSLSHHLLF